MTLQAKHSYAHFADVEKDPGRSAKCPQETSAQRGRRWNEPQPAFLLLPTCAPLPQPRLLGVEFLNHKQAKVITGLFTFYRA